VRPIANRFAAGLPMLAPLLITRFSIGSNSTLSQNPTVEARKARTRGMILK